MKLHKPPSSEWESVKKEFEEKLANYKSETDLREFLTKYPWILSLAFGSSEGVVFSEYPIDSNNKTDHLVISGRSLYMRVTLVELKRPDAKIATSKSTYKAMTTALMQTDKRMSVINSNPQHFLSDLKKNIIKLADKDSKNPYQGAIHENFFDVIRFDHLDSFTLLAKVIIGRRENETLDEINYRKSKWQSGIEIMPYNRLLDYLERPPNFFEPEWSWS